MLEGFLPARPLDEQLAGFITVHLGGRAYELPTLSRRENRAWKAELNDKMGALLEGVAVQDDPGAMMAALALGDETMVALVRSYDRTGVLPSDDSPELEHDTDQEWLRALLACSAAAYPFVGLALAVQRQRLPTLQPAPMPSTNGRPKSGTGRRASSKRS